MMESEDLPRIITTPFTNGDSVCKILAACREAGVLSFKHGSLEVQFAGFNPSNDSTLQQTRIFGPATTPAEKVLGETIQAQQRAEVSSIEDQELDLKEQRIAELLITDPSEAERLMELGELEPIGDADGGDSE